MTGETRSALRGLKVLARLTLAVYAFAAWLFWLKHRDWPEPWTVQGGKILLGSMFTVIACMILATTARDGAWRAENVRVRDEDES